MLKNEKNYDFRKRLLEIHKSGICDKTLQPKENEFVAFDGMKIAISRDSGIVIKTAAKDFLDFLLTSMELSCGISYDDGDVLIKIDETISEDYIINVSDKIEITGQDERKAAQALYYLEDKMTERKAPFIEKKEVKHTYMFSPRMVHSGYKMGEFPDSYLARIAHSGINAIVVFGIEGVNQTHAGPLDFNDLCDRAEKYGIDVYAYSYVLSRRHPDDPDAQEHYDSIYGEIFKACPKFKGMILVGESVEFPSKDPHVSPKSFDDNKDDGIPTGKLTAGWWPCEDYPQWLECIKKAIYKYNEDADIIFWTYNWGCVEEEARVKLIRTLPQDVTLQATFEMFEIFPLGENMTQVSADYSIAFPGPGKYFLSEAKEAKKRGLKLYSMTNTAGLTWDMGDIPFEPMPYQWMKRYKGMRDAYENYGLSGTMDSHHYGLWPSFISDLAKKCFIKENTDMEKCLDEALIMHYGDKHLDTLKEALKKWSDAIGYFTPTDTDQYGAFRVGPSFPFCLITEAKPPSVSYAHYGNRILHVLYPCEFDTKTRILPLGKKILPFIRLPEEIKSMEKMLNLLKEGVKIIKSIPDPNEELLFLINLGEYMVCHTQTGFNAKKWYYLRTKLFGESDPKKCYEYIEALRTLGLEELENSEKAIEFVNKDSRLGWEPSMEYLTDEEHIRWKIKHLHYVLDKELDYFKRGTDYSFIKPE